MSSQVQEFDFSVNLLDSLLWQYNDAVNLQKLLEEKNAWLQENQANFWNDWYRDVFDLRTANAFGLQVWAIILGESLYSNLPPAGGGNAWGFGVNRKNFNNGNFAAQNGGNTIFSPEVSRLLLQLKYFKMTSSGTVPETNRMLKYLFGHLGNAYVIDNHDMTITYMFNFVIPSEMLYMLNYTGVLPTPAGVESQIIGL